VENASPIWNSLPREEMALGHRSLTLLPARQYTGFPE
jgi:hypothetical protein